jgi:hypothetical protein
VLWLWFGALDACGLALWHMHQQQPQLRIWQAGLISSSPVSCILLLLSACTLLMPAASAASTAGAAGASAGGGSGWWCTTSLQGRLRGRRCWSMASRMGTVWVRRCHALVPCMRGDMRTGA